MSGTLADRVTALRSRRGLTRAALAHLIGVSRPTLWAWETGKGQPRAQNLEALAEALAVSAEFIRFGAAVSEEIDSLTDGQELSIQLYIAHVKKIIAGMADVSVDKVSISIEY